MFCTCDLKHRTNVLVPLCVVSTREGDELSGSFAHKIIVTFSVEHCISPEIVWKAGLPLASYTILVSTAITRIAQRKIFSPRQPVLPR